MSNTNSKTKDPFNFQETSNEDKLIENRDYLKISHIPKELKFRDEKVQEIVHKVFRPAIEGYIEEDAVITGEPGTGKTAAVKYITRQLEEHYDTSQTEIVYVNCKINNSEQEVIATIMEELGMEYKRGVATSKNTKKFLRKYNSKEEPALVVILDEIDELHKDRRSYLNKVLYTLSRPSTNINEEWKGELGLVCVSNDSNFYNYIDFDVDDSSFSPERFEFLTYDAEEVTQILMERQQEAFSEEIIDENNMSDIGEIVEKRFNSDVRVGIKILKKIPKFVDKEDIELGSVNQEKVVEKAIREVKKNRIEKVLNGKDDHFLILMSAAVQNMRKDKSKLDYIVDAYREACEKAAVEKNEGEGDDSRGKSKSYVRRRLEYLVRENLLDKQKRYDKARNPYYYEPKMDLDLFEELVNERLMRSGIYDRLKEFRDSSSVDEEKAKEEFDDKMEELGIET